MVSKFFRPLKNLSFLTFLVGYLMVSTVSAKQAPSNHFIKSAGCILFQNNKVSPDYKLWLKSSEKPSSKGSNTLASLSIVFKGGQVCALNGRIDSAFGFDTRLTTHTWEGLLVNPECSLELKLNHGKLTLKDPAGNCSAKFCGASVRIQTRILKKAVASQETCSKQDWPQEES
jgi:hypothetical protein